MKQAKHTPDLMAALKASLLPPLFTAWQKLPEATTEKRLAWERWEEDAAEERCIYCAAYLPEDWGYQICPKC